MAPRCFRAWSAAWLLLLACFSDVARPCDSARSSSDKLVDNLGEEGDALQPGHLAPKLDESMNRAERHRGDAEPPGQEGDALQPGHLAPNLNESMHRAESHRGFGERLSVGQGEEDFEDQDWWRMASGISSSSVARNRAASGADAAGYQGSKVFPVSVVKVEVLPDEFSIRMSKVKITARAPKTCQPACRAGTKFSTSICGGQLVVFSYDDLLWSTQEFSVILPSPDPILNPRSFTKNGNFNYIEVIVPECKIRGNALHVKLKEGIVKFFYLPRDWQVGTTAIFAYDVDIAQEEALAFEQEAIGHGNRCCCLGPNCQWYEGSVLSNQLYKKTCPYLQEYQDGREACTRRSCGSSKKNRQNCQKLHHGAGLCVKSSLPDFHFQGKRCGKDILSKLARIF